MKSEFYNTICAYVNCCCFTLSKEQFEEILDENVELFHQTNEEPPVIAQGRTKVSELFNKYVFENSSDIVLKEANIKAPESDEQKFSLRLLVEETKTTDKMFKSRFLFEECTNFQFNEAEPKKITAIYMQVKRVPLP